MSRKTRLEIIRGELRNCSPCESGYAAGGEFLHPPIRTSVSDDRGGSQVRITNLDHVTTQKSADAVDVTGGLMTIIVDKPIPKHDLIAVEEDNRQFLSSVVSCKRKAERYIITLELVWQLNHNDLANASEIRKLFPNHRRSAHIL